MGLEDNCTVCLVEFVHSDVCRYTPCFHYFHINCLEQWLKKHETCPICRKDLSLIEL